MSIINAIRAETHMYKQKELILQLDTFTPEVEALLYELIKQGEDLSEGASAAVRKLVELDKNLDLKQLAKQLKPLVSKKVLFQMPLVQQLLQCADKERSRELLLLLMEDYWIAKAVVSEMRNYGRDDKALIDAAEQMLPTINDAPSVQEMEYWIKQLRT